MALTIVTNPVGSATKKLFAGFQKIEFVFKREDLAVVSVADGGGGVIVTTNVDIRSSVGVGDSIYLYSVGANYIYSRSGVILSITATDVTLDIPFVQSATGGYINYKKNYYVEMELVDKALPLSKLLPFTLQSDGDAAGNITLDVSTVNDLNRQRNGTLAKQHLSEGRQEFEVQYREVFSGSANSYTLIDNKLLIVLYALETPEEDELLTDFTLPKLFLGYPTALVVAHSPLPSGTLELKYKEKDINGLATGNGTLGTLDADDSGFLMWLWPAAASVKGATKYIDFEDFAFGGGVFDFASPDFAYPDFVTQ